MFLKKKINNYIKKIITICFFNFLFFYNKQIFESKFYLNFNKKIRQKDLSWILVTKGEILRPFTHFINNRYLLLKYYKLYSYYDQKISINLYRYKFFISLIFTYFCVILLFVNQHIETLFYTNIFFSIIMLLLIALILIVIIPYELKNIIHFIGIITTSFLYFLSLFLWLFFNRFTPKFQFGFSIIKIDFLNSNLFFAIDGISLFFILLTTLIGPLLFLSSWYIKNNIKILSITILAIEIFTILTFSALDLFIFFVVFESLLIPLFISILQWGSGQRRIKAALMLLVYTLLSSIFFLIAIFTIYLEIGSTSFFSILEYSFIGFTESKQKFLWLLLFFAFAVKVPIYPLHSWLPEAHVEAPTHASVVLASLLLKTGGYGIFRFLLPFFTLANQYFLPLVYSLCTIGVIYAALAALRQLDIKRIIAYLSISHMNFCVLGQFSENIEGLVGSLLLMLAHGIVAAAFFISIGILYKRYHTRLISYYGGLTRVMPIFSIILFIFTLGNMNMPGTSNFIGELLILIGVCQKSTLVTILVAIGSAFGALCTIWLWSRIMFGELKIQFLHKFLDLSRKEFNIFSILVVCNFFLGLCVNEFVDTLYASVYFLYTTIIL